MSFPANFHDIRFPIEIAFGAMGGPERLTEVVSLGSGHEERNSRWADSRRRYNAGYGVRSLDDLNAVISFFEERRGRLYGFRWRDFADWKSCPPLSPPSDQDQALGAGDGVAASFALVKTYGNAHAPYVRRIHKPVAGTVQVAVDGQAQSLDADFSLDADQGVITFQPHAVPPAGAAVTAGFAFDVPVRFDTDHLNINLTTFHAGDIPSIPLLEIRL